MTNLSTKHGIHVSVAALFFSSLLLSGCQVAPLDVDENTEPSISEGTEQSETENYPYSPAEKLLTQILVGEFALQRGELQEALNYLSQAAEQSQNKRLVMQAFQLAMETERYQRAITLAELLRDIEPENPNMGIMLSEPHFKLGNADQALVIIHESILNMTREDFVRFKAIALFLSGQSKHPILDDYLAHAQQHAEDARISIVAAYLAYQIEDLERFSELIDQTLNLAPDWETPAIMKLTFMDELEAGPTEIFLYADQHLRQYPEQKLFRTQYANFLIDYKYEDLALAQVEFILEQDPDYLDALLLAGSLQFYNDPEESQVLLSRYLELGGLDPQAVFNLSELAKRNKDYKQALNQLYSIGTDSQFYLEARIRIARIYEERDGIEAGIKYLDGIAIRDQSELMRIVLEKDRMYQDVKDYENSRAVFDEILVREPNNARLLYRRGLLFAIMNLLDLHELDMRKVIELEPDNAYAYNALGYVLSDKTDRLDEAFELISHAMELKPNDPYIIDSLGWVYFRLGNTERAIEHLTTASKLLWDAEIAAHLGEVLWVAEQRDKAIDLWNRALEDFPDHPVLNETIQRFQKTNSSVNFDSTHQSTP